MNFRLSFAAIFLFAQCLLTADAYAQLTDSQKTEIRAAFEAISKNGTRGPATIDLIGQAKLQLPEKMIFAPKVEGKRLMEAWGNQVSDEGFVGLILPISDKAGWVLPIDYEAAGYVSDSDQKDIKPDTLLEQLRDSTEEGNKFRAQKGVPPIEVAGWTEPPAYNPQQHTLVWSATVQDKGAPANAPQTVNYNTRLLGREGFLSLNLIDDRDAIGGDRATIQQLLAGTSFNEGKRYADFNAKTDHIAEFGLAALIGGIAVKKLGLLALLGVYLLKVWKLGAVALAVAASALRKFFKRGQT